MCIRTSFTTVYKLEPRVGMLTSKQQNIPTLLLLYLVKQHMEVLVQCSHCKNIKDWSDIIWRVGGKGE